MSGLCKTFSPEWAEAKISGWMDGGMEGSRTRGKQDLSNSGKKVKQLLALRQVFNRTSKLSSHFSLYLLLETLHYLDLFCPWGRSVRLSSPVGLLDLSFNVLRLGVGGSRDDSGVGETCLQQVGEDEDEEDCAHNRDDRGDPLCGERIYICFCVCDCI